jgi:hypothetical protein
MKRVEAVRAFRMASKSAPTRKLADMPTRFHVENIPDKPYLLVPRHSSEKRVIIPIGFVDPSSLSGDANLIIPHATLFHFGVLSSAMHMVWVRYICGRLKSDYRYSKDIVYNNFPWPSEHTEKQKAAIEQAAQGVLDARAAHPDASLADLYDPVAMPPDLRRAHQALDKAVDAAYVGAGFKPAPTKSDAERVAFLFELYHRYTSMLPAPEAPKRRKKK